VRGRIAAIQRSATRLDDRTEQLAGESPVDVVQDDRDIRVDLRNGSADAGTRLHAHRSEDLAVFKQYDPLAVHGEQQDRRAGDDRAEAGLALLLGFFSPDASDGAGGLGGDGLHDDAAPHRDGVLGMGGQIHATHDDAFVTEGQHGYGSESLMVARRVAPTGHQVIESVNRLSSANQLSAGILGWVMADVLNKLGGDPAAVGVQFQLPGFDIRNVHPAAIDAIQLHGDVQQTVQGDMQVTGHAEAHADVALDLQQELAAFLLGNVA
jgi:hypothetical protein